MSIHTYPYATHSSYSHDDYPDYPKTIRPLPESAFPYYRYRDQPNRNQYPYEHLLNNRLPYNRVPQYNYPHSSGWRANKYVQSTKETNHKGDQIKYINPGYDSLYITRNRRIPQKEIIRVRSMDLGEKSVRRETEYELENSIIHPKHFWTNGPVGQVFELTGARIAYDPGNVIADTYDPYDKDEKRFRNARVKRKRRY